MATNYPSSVDSITRPNTTDALNSPSHTQVHDDVADAVEAIETYAVQGLNGGREVVSTVNPAGTTETLNLTSANVFDITLDENITFTFSGTVASKSCSFTLITRQDGTGTNTITWPTSVDWPGGTIPDVTTTASAVDIWTFMTVDNGTTWYGFQAGKDMKSPP